MDDEVAEHDESADERRARHIETAAGAIEDAGHDWDEDPGEWVREQRRADPRRVG